MTMTLPSDPVRQNTFKLSGFEFEGNMMTYFGSKYSESDAFGKCKFKVQSEWGLNSKNDVHFANTMDSITSYNGR